MTNKGFTLLEILIVIVILGVIAGLAVPVFTANIDKAKAQEAYLAIGVIRGTLVTHWAMSSTDPGSRTYEGLQWEDAAAPGYIGFDPNAAVAGQTLHFHYDLEEVTQATYTIVATCTGCNMPGRIKTNEAGISTPEGCFS